MDIAKTITHISLCSGYGGIDLGLRRAISNLRTIAYSEIEAFACANLVSKMEAGHLDPAPIWTNLKTFPWESFSGKVDILSGGYPCQPFSTAGKRNGGEDERHLWPFIANGIRACNPRVCFFENVEGHITMGLPSVISDLEEMGYKVSWGIFSAAEVGAPHQRKRVFILANNNNCWELQQKGGIKGKWRWIGNKGVWPTRPREPQHKWEPPRTMDVSKSKRQQEPGDIKGHSFESSGRRETESKMGGDANGLVNWLDNAKLYQSSDNRCDELRLLGNGVVPTVAEKAFIELMK